MIDVKKGARYLRYIVFFFAEKHVMVCYLKRNANHIKGLIKTGPKCKVTCGHEQNSKEQTAVCHCFLYGEALKLP